MRLAARLSSPARPSSLCVDPFFGRWDQKGTILEIDYSAASGRGADLSILSVFEGERELAFPPLTYLQTKFKKSKGGDQYVPCVHHRGHKRIIQCTMKVNTTSMPLIQTVIKNFNAQPPRMNFVKLGAMEPFEGWAKEHKPHFFCALTGKLLQAPVMLTGCRADAGPFYEMRDLTEWLVEKKTVSGGPSGRGRDGAQTSPCERTPAHASLCERTPAHASPCEPMRAHTSPYASSHEPILRAHASPHEPVRAYFASPCEPILRVHASLSCESMRVASLGAAIVLAGRQAAGHGRHLGGRHTNGTQGARSRDRAGGPCYLAPDHPDQPSPNPTQPTHSPRAPPFLPLPLSHAPTHPLRRRRAPNALLCDLGSCASLSQLTDWQARAVHEMNAKLENLADQRAQQDEKVHIESIDKLGHIFKSLDVLKQGQWQVS